MKEIWKPIVGYEGRYEVSNLGRVRSLDRVVTRSDGVKRRYRGRLMKLGSERGGYLRVMLAKDTKDKCHKVHKLVARAFIGPRPVDQQIMHLDGNQAHNCKVNLRYGTAKENAAHKKLHGTHPAGELNSRAVLSSAAVKRIRSLRGKVSTGQLAKRYGVSSSHISCVQLGKAWAHV